MAKPLLNVHSCHKISWIMSTEGGLLRLGMNIMNEVIHDCVSVRSCNTFYMTFIFLWFIGVSAWVSKVSISHVTDIRVGCYLATIRR